MKQDIRKGIKSSVLYKRIAYYQSQGFIALIKFLEDENLIDKFYEECNFNKNYFIDNLKDNQDISIEEFLGHSKYSFSFARSKRGFDFWYDKIFYNENYQKIRNKLL